MKEVFTISTITYREIPSPREKSAVCENTLRALPDWFGNEAAIVDYAGQVRGLPLCAAFDGDVPVGFVALKRHNEFTAEVCVMGVLQAYHRRGIGKKLIEWCEGQCAAQGMRFLTVKTLDASAESAGYGRTRAFYRACGFIPLEVFPTIWDEDNPCLFLAKCMSETCK